jgi:hypothetical protein
LKGKIMTTYEIIEQEVETEMTKMGIDENNYPSRSGYLKVSLISEKRNNKILQNRLTARIKELEIKLEELSK